MGLVDRRAFLQRTGRDGLKVAAAGAATAAIARPRAAHGVAANEKISLAIVGLRGRGGNLARDFAKRPDTTITYLADVDSAQLDARKQMVTDLQGSAPKTVQDFRRVLEDTSVDAVVIATPDHWHSLATIWACQANKDVYVEKPASQSPWEGRKMVEAARKYSRVVQLGTQCRSAPYLIAAKRYLDDGKLGTIHMVRVYGQKGFRGGKPAPDSATPAGLNWDMWTGPAELRQYNPQSHNGWYWLWRFSGGEIINDSVHQMDVARWLIGRKHPQSVYAMGGKYAYKDDFTETPDTMAVTFQFDDLVMTYESTLYTPYMLKSDPFLRDNDMFPHWPQSAMRIEIFGSEGLMVVGRHGGGWQVFARPKDRQPVVAAQQYGRFPDPEHKQNFVDCLRSRELPNADIEEGHLSTMLCQLGNISHKLGGRKLVVDPDTEQIVGDDEACAMLKRDYRHPWVVPDQV